MSVREVFVPYVGAPLPNGALVVAVKQTAPNVGVVLAINLPNSPRAEYVTWLLDDSGLAYSGRYFRDLDSAVSDYTERT